MRRKHPHLGTRECGIAVSGDGGGRGGDRAGGEARRVGGGGVNGGGEARLVGGGGGEGDSEGSGDGGGLGGGGGNRGGDGAIFMRMDVTPCLYRMVVVNVDLRMRFFERNSLDMQVLLLKQQVVFYLFPLAAGMGRFQKYFSEFSGGQGCFFEFSEGRSPS